LNDYRSSRQFSELLLAAASFLGGLGLIWYGKVVLRKLKHISYL